jgi:GNAT superfamily N-acetyltransferase
MEAVREAAAADEVRFGELMAELVEGIVSQRGGSQLVDPDHVPVGLSELLADPNRLVLLGTLDDMVTGVAVCHHEDRAGRGRQGSFDACYVEPGARGMGLGGLLLDTAVSWFEEHGCAGIDGVALPGDRQAKRFFEAAGFKARLITMHRPLG